MKEIKRDNCGKKIAILLDNCSVHKAKRVREFAIGKKIELVYYKPYSPQYNGIDKLWALMKQMFRKQLTYMKIREE